VLKKEMYETYEGSFTIEEGKTNDLDIRIKPAFAGLTIEINPKDADIYIDKQKTALGSYFGRLNKGMHVIEAKHAKYYEQSRSITIIEGENQELKIDLKPRTGVLSVRTFPPKADIMIDGEEQGQSPKFIKDLIIGQYRVELAMEGYARHMENVTITENETTTMDVTMESSRKVTINSDPEGASVYIDGNLTGSTPLEADLSFGQHKIKVTRNGCNDDERTIEVTKNSEIFMIDLVTSDEEIAKRATDIQRFYSFSQPPSKGAALINSYIGRVSHPLISAYSIDNEPVLGTPLLGDVVFLSQNRLINNNVAFFGGFNVLGHSLISQRYILVNFIGFKLGVAAYTNNHKFRVIFDNTFGFALNFQFNNHHLDSSNVVFGSLNGSSKPSERSLSTFNIIPMISSLKMEINVFKDKYLVFEGGFIIGGAAKFNWYRESNVEAWKKGGDKPSALNKDTYGSFPGLYETKPYFGIGLRF